jgi:uncharacterized membrane protein (UPF0127 family)
MKGRPMGGFFFPRNRAMICPMKHSQKLTIRGRAMLIAAIFAISAATLSCSAQKASEDGTDKPNPTLKKVTLVSGQTQVVAEVAATETERNRGLMFRKTLADGNGMLFVFETDQRVSFWMKNTSLPLSLAYLASDGTILQILDLKPFSEEPRPSERSIRYALEVPQGWFAKVGLKPGDRFEIPR